MVGNQLRIDRTEFTGLPNLHQNKQNVSHAQEQAHLVSYFFGSASPIVVIDRLSEQQASNALAVAISI